MLWSLVSHKRQHRPIGEILKKWQKIPEGGGPSSVLKERGNANEWEKYSAAKFCASAYSPWPADQPALQISRGRLRCIFHNRRGHSVALRVRTQAEQRLGTQSLDIDPGLK